MTDKGNSVQPTQLTNDQRLVGATMLVGGPVDQAALRQAEQAVGFEWKPGDVILDLYEVRKVAEGFGKDAIEKDYHEGGFGRVYKVWHRTWHREMAVKTPRAHVITTQEQKDAFTRECETWVNLGLHAHITACHYVRELGGAPRVFSEYADAGTLEDWIRSKRLYEGDKSTVLARILDAAIQFAWGLHYAHARGVIHQDVKPLNALMWEAPSTPLAGSGQAITLKVTDFGLAGARQKAGITVQSGDPAGGIRSIMVSTGGMTPSHCSPEQAAGQKLDRRTDVWSWAVSVLETFQGEVTWHSGSAAAEALEVFLEHNGEEEGIPAMPSGVASLLRRCFQKSPELRPRTLRECAAILCELFQAETDTPYYHAEPLAIVDTANSLNNRALSLIDLGKPAEAERLLDQALEMDKFHLAATYNRGLMRWRVGLCLAENILRDLEAIKSKYPNEATVACALGWVLLEGGNFREAAEQFEKAMAMGDETGARAAFQIGRSFALAGIGDPRIIPGPMNASSLSVSPDGNYILTTQSQNVFWLWEVATGKCVRTFEGHTGVVQCVSYSPDGRFAFSGSTDTTVRLWDVSTGQCVRAFEGHEGPVRSVACSSKGRFVLSGSSDGMLRLWNVSTGQCLRTMKGCLGVYSPDGRCILASGEGISFGKTLRLWNVSTGQCVRTFEGHEDPVYSIAFSPDSGFALSGGCDATLRLWNVTTGQCLRTFKGHTDWVHSVAYSPDGRFVLSGSSDRTLRLWNVSTGQCVRTYVRPVKSAGWGSVDCVAFSPDTRFVFSIGGDCLNFALRIWDASSVAEQRCLAHWFYTIAISAQDACIRQSSYDYCLSHARNSLNAGRISEALAFLRQARAIPGFERRTDGLDLWVRAGARARIKAYGGGWLRRIFDGHTDQVTCGLFSPDGQFTLSGSKDKTLRLWDVNTGICVRTFEGHQDTVQSAAYSPDGHTALSGSDDKTCRLWNVATGQCLRTFEGHQERVRSVAFSPDNRFVLSASGDSTLRVWDITNGKCLRTHPCEPYGFYSVLFSPIGYFACSPDDPSTFVLLDAATGQCLRTYAGHKWGVWSVALSANSCLVLSGSADKTLRLWDVATGQCVRTFKGHQELVCSVAFSPDSRFALSGSDDATLRLWDVATGQCLRVFDGHTWRVHSVAFSPNGRFVISGSTEKALRLWELDWEYEYDSEHDPVLKANRQVTKTI